MTECVAREKRPTRRRQVGSNGPGARAVSAAERRTQPQRPQVETSAGLARQLFYSGIWSKAVLLADSRFGAGGRRGGARSRGAVDERLAAADCAHLPGHADYMCCCGAGQRSVPPTSTFSASIVRLLCFHYTGKFNDFDWTIYWCNEVAWLLQPALFLHFALTFPERRGYVGRHPRSVALLYMPVWRC